MSRGETGSMGNPALASISRRQAQPPSSPILPGWSWPISRPRSTKRKRDNGDASRGARSTMCRCGQPGGGLAAIVAMIRAASILRAGEFDHAGVIDRVALDADDRHRRRLVLTGERGTTFLLDLPHATPLRDGDGLVLDDGAIVRI